MTAAAGTAGSGGRVPMSRSCTADALGGLTSCATATAATAAKRRTPGGIGAATTRPPAACDAAARRRPQLFDTRARICRLWMPRGGGTGALMFEPTGTGRSASYRRVYHITARGPTAERGRRYTPAVRDAFPRYLGCPPAGGRWVRVDLETGSTLVSAAFGLSIDELVVGLAPRTSALNAMMEMVEGFGGVHHVPDPALYSVNLELDALLAFSLVSERMSAGIAGLRVVPPVPLVVPRRVSPVRGFVRRVGVLLCPPPQARGSIGLLRRSVRRSGPSGQSPDHSTLASSTSVSSRSTASAVSWVTGGFRSRRFRGPAALHLTD